MRSRYRYPSSESREEMLNQLKSRQSDNIYDMKAGVSSDSEIRELNLFILKKMARKQNLTSVDFAPDAIGYQLFFDKLYAVHRKGAGSTRT